MAQAGIGTGARRAGWVVVTGGASGIGQASAIRLARAGWSVALFDREADALQRAADLVGPGTSTHVVDVTDEAGIAAALTALGGPIRGLVNSAGIAANTPLAETSAALFRKILDVNVVGSFLMAQQVVPYMAAAGGGSIVNIASVSGLQGNMGRTAYGASKGAVVTMTKVMAVELAASLIRVNAVAPGPVDTPMIQALHSEAERELWLTHVPMRRYATPDEIAGGIAYLLDEDLSSYVTGHILAVDGGFASGGTIRPLA
jgi:NAD(P)-dependent dehydrogenase (short-subunit alcohol dehydrogenase family)